jgi:hypothetical protein
MRTGSKLGVLFVFVSALAFAETWSGTLYDAKCASQAEKADLSACAPTESSTMFILQVSDKQFKFDAEGNKKAAAAYKQSKSGAERAEAPDEPKLPGMGEQHREAVMATVEGTLAGEEIKVETIEVK